MDNIYQSILEIIRIEEEKNPDWDLIRSRIMSILDKLNSGNLWNDVEGVLHRYLDDLDIRQGDSKYGAWQREQARHFIQGQLRGVGLR